MSQARADSSDREPGPAARELIERAVAARTEAGERFFARQAEPIARLCHRMAERFARGGRLIALGASPAARSDARHVAVEFVHPVIVGKRALPALAIGPEGGTLEAQTRLAAAPDDMVMAFGPAAECSAALRAAAAVGCLTIAYEDGLDADARFVPAVTDPLVGQELIETLYHLLWELVHVFFDHRGLLAGREARPRHDPGASSFLYPFLSEGESDLEAVVADVRRSVQMKAAEVVTLRSQTLHENAAELAGAARVIAGSFAAGGKLLALGNGGSATDAMDLVADLRDPPRGWPARPALDLTEDSAILTAIGNDVGHEALFARQIIAYGRPVDTVVGLSTSGDSGNLLAALAEARKRGLRTVALVGYDGGRVAAEKLADHVIVTRSTHVPRIQEAQASAYHVLRELLEVAGEAL